MYGVRPDGTPAPLSARAQFPPETLDLPEQLLALRRPLTLAPSPQRREPLQCEGNHARKDQLVSR
jgi:hypothetical protein